MTERTLLLVDDEENILRALVRLLRRDGYTILTANSGQQGLELLEQHPVGVILADQRMPGMIGSEFLELAKERRPATIRLMLSGYTELQSVTDAINRGAIYKFLTKPWEDDLLRENIRQAFEQHELRAERNRLAVELREANERLAAANLGLERRVESQSAELGLNQRILELSREVLEHLPVGVMGVGDDGVIAIANNRMHEFLGLVPGSLLGQDLVLALPPPMNATLCLPLQEEAEEVVIHVVEYQGRRFSMHCSRLGMHSSAKGSLLVMVPEKED